MRYIFCTPCVGGKRPQSPRFAPRGRAGLAPLLLLTLAACGGANRPNGPYAHLPSGELNMQAARVVESTRVAHVYFANNSTIPSSRSDSLKLPEGAQEALVSTPRGENIAREKSITRRLRSQGMRSDQIRLLPHAGLEPGEYRVEFLLAYAVPPACPDWSQNSSYNYRNEVFSNFGCANVTNLSQQIADPRQLERAPGNVRPDAARTSAVLGVYSSNSMPWPSSQLAREGFSKNDILITPPPAASGGADAATAITGATGGGN